MEIATIRTLNPLPRSATPPLADLKMVENKDYKTVVVYGKGGVGKTYVGISKAPSPVEWIDIDHRADTQYSRFKDRIGHLYQPNTKEEIENAVAWAIYHLKEHYTKTGKKGTLVFDSYTKAKQVIKEDYLISQGRPVNDKTSIEEKGIVKATVMRIVDNIKHSQMNVVVTSEEGIQIIGEEKDGKQRIKAVISGAPKSEDDLEYFCDYIIHLYEAQIRVDGTNEYVKRYLWDFRKSSTSRILERTDLVPKEDCDWEKLTQEIELLKKVEIQQEMKK